MEVIDHNDARQVGGRNSEVLSCPKLVIPGGWDRNPCKKENVKAQSILCCINQMQGYIWGYCHLQCYQNLEWVNSHLLSPKHQHSDTSYVKMQTNSSQALTTLVY